MPGKKVALALSGGLDSAVAAALLLEQGYDVTGIHAVFYRNGCYPSADIVEGVADKNETLCHHIGDILSIPVVTLDLQSEFKHHVIKYFCDEYSRGRTPNPCIICNQCMKFGLLMEKALAAAGADLFATGHYASVVFIDGYYRLLRGADSSKDQSYMLYRLKGPVLSKVLFPLGSMSFSDVLSKGNEYELQKIVYESSQDICFIEGGYGEFISERCKFSPGEIVDREGKQIGLHKGIIFYTVGQRQGLGLTSEKPLYVTAIEAAVNRIVVGTEDRLYRDSFNVGDVSWVAEPLEKGAREVDVKIRYLSALVPAVINMQGSIVYVHLEKAQKAITPGQSAVFYCGNEVLGGGIIES